MTGEAGGVSGEQPLRPRADAVIARLRTRIGELESENAQIGDIVDQLVERVAAAENRAARAEEALAAAAQPSSDPAAEPAK